MKTGTAKAVPVGLGRGGGLRFLFQPGHRVRLGGDFQLRGLDVGVNLCRVQIFMAQHILDGLHIHAAGEHQRGGGVDVKTVQDVLGHENLNTTQIYTHIESTELKIAAEANPIARLEKEN